MVKKELLTIKRDGFSRAEGASWLPCGDNGLGEGTKDEDHRLSEGGTEGSLASCPSLVLWLQSKMLL